MDLDTKKAPALVIFAQRAMFRAGRQWQAGRNELTDEQCRELGEAKIKAVLADPNFTVAASTDDGAIILTSEGRPIDAHTVVTAQRSMFRGGRKWNAGANPLTAKEVADLGDKLDLVKADTGNFVVLQGAATDQPAVA